MSVIVDARQGIRQRVIAVSGLPTAANRKWEGKDFTPNPGTPWMRETMLRPSARPQRMNPGPFARLRHTGIYQVSLFYPPDSDEDVKPIETAAEAIRAAFPDTLEFLYNSQKIRIHGVGIPTVTEETNSGANWLHCPVSIDWSADTFNAS